MAGVRLINYSKSEPNSPNRANDHHIFQPAYYVSIPAGSISLFYGFVARPLGSELNAHLAFEDVMTVLAFILKVDQTLADAIGAELSSSDD